MPLKRASRTRLTKAAVSGESASPVPEVELASTASDADTDDAYRRRPGSPEDRSASNCSSTPRQP